MVNINHLTILNQGLDDWNEWRKAAPEIIPDLREENFNNFDFSGYDLTGVNFENASLKQASFSNTPLYQAIFSGADLSEVNLTRKMLSDTSLAGANLSCSILSESVLDGSDLSYANLEGVDLSDASLQQANLSNASLREAYLARACFVGANLYRTNFSNSDLTEADLSGANLDGANFENANLLGIVPPVLQNIAFDRINGRETEPSLVQTNISWNILQQADPQSFDLITELSREQKKIISLYRNKWSETTLSPKVLNRNEIGRLIAILYQTIDEKLPEFVFFGSPYAALLSLENQCLYSLWSKKINPLIVDLRQQVISQVSRNLYSYLKEQFLTQVSIQINEQIILELEQRLATQSYSKIFQGFQPEIWVSDISLMDFCITVLGCKCKLGHWTLLAQLVEKCSWFFPFRDICLVCAPPAEVLVDDQGRISKNVKPVILFADEFCVHYRG